MCDDAASKVNNALHRADDDDAVTITLEYGAFMN